MRKVYGFRESKRTRVWRRLAIILATSGMCVAALTSGGIALATGSGGVAPSAEYNGPTLPSPAFVNAITPGGSGKITFYRYWPGSSGTDARWYIMQNSGSTTSTTFFVYDAQNNDLLNNFTISLPTALQGVSIVNSFAVDPAGNVYVGTHAFAGGSVSQWLWTPGHTSAVAGWSAFTPGLLVGGVYGYTDSNGVYRVAAVTGNPAASNTHTEAYSDTYNAATGLVMGTNNLIGTDIQSADAHNGDLVAVDTNGSDPTDNSIAIWNATGTTETLYVSAGPSPASSWSAKPSGANELSNGNIIMPSFATREVAVFSPAGALLGTIGADHGAGEPLDTIDDAMPVEVENNNIYYVAENPFSTPNKLTYFATATATAYLAASQGAPVHLGLGAGLTSTAVDNYFPSGSTPSVDLQFNQWWQAVSGDFTGRYTVLNIDQVLNNNPGIAQSFSIPSSVSDYSDQSVNVPLQLPTATPGVYQVNAELLQGGVVVGADSLVYTVGAADDTFNPASIPTGTDASGVYLAHEFGQKLYRSSYTIDSCYPGVTTPTPATPLTCPSAMVADVASAASLAAEDGVTYEIQLGTGTAFDQSAVSTSGVLQHLVKQMVTEFPEVTYWECWNEPDNNTFSSASQYVIEALEPCYSAVKSVSQADKVIGISNDGHSVANYENYVRAGALNYLDIVAVHPYTGFNQSWAKQGMVIPSIYDSFEAGKMEALQNYLTSAGYNGPLFDTESGFWNGTPAEPSTYYEQGDALVTKYILEESIGMDWANNFYDDGGYTVNGLYWGLLGGADNILNPGGLAVMNFAATLGGRSFLYWIATGVPHTYAALYGPSATGSNDVVALWADDVNVNVVPMLSSGATMQVASEYGAPSALANGSFLELTSQVNYISVPAGQTLAFEILRHQSRRPLPTAMIKHPVLAS